MSIKQIQPRFIVLLLFIVAGGILRVTAAGQLTPFSNFSPLGAMALFGYSFSATALLLPLLLIPQFLLTLGLCWLLAALGVFFRDLGQIMGFLLTVWFFTTPICYDERSLPQNYLWLFELNPMFVLVRAYRDVLLHATPPS